MKMNQKKICLIITLLFFYLLFVSAPMARQRTITDSMGRHIHIQKTPIHVICSGAGALRLLTYFQAQNIIVAVDSIETRKMFIDARPYALANPQFKNYPIFGEYRGNDNPERIVCLDPQPDVIFKTFADMGYNPEELQRKIAIPVIVLNYGDLTHYRSALYQSIHIMGDVLNKIERAIEITTFFDQVIADLKARTTDIKEGVCTV